MVNRSLKPGDRVRIAEHHHWAQGALGTVGVPPAAVSDLTVGEAAWEVCSRVVQGGKGPILFVWVEFDVRQVDDDGDGPYRGAEIQAEYLEPLPPVGEPPLEVLA